MSSVSQLFFDDVEVDEWRAHIPDEVIALFQEDDRNESMSADGRQIIRYTASRDIVLQRLDIMGITSEVAREAFEAWKQELLESHQDEVIYVEGQDTPLRLEVFSITYEQWQQRVPSVLAARFGETLADPTSAIMQDTNSGWLPFEAHDYRAAIRALLDASRSTKVLSLDVTDLVNAGYYDKDKAICLQLRHESAAHRPVLEPIVIFTEGSSDVRILRLSLEALYPHLTYYFSFFDHNELNVDGGADYLLKFIKAFATSGMYVRLIAVFDNDAVGIAAAHKTRGLALPDRIQVLTLPDIHIARAYPTTGPQGTHEVDVNGGAASIELYLGRHNLLGRDNQLIPV